ncbi:hypothetical protein [Anthocerotibacter panamensis]|uniref:hypothetical protein n=1 Tax=Anthocerotibacter panamensis TaxID=2857077 RepID=UPI001C408A9E|nr:hypothetical protein [Anthocerotibacter panamensis]
MLTSHKLHKPKFSSWTPPAKPTPTPQKKPARAKRPNPDPYRALPIELKEGAKILGLVTPNLYWR